MNRKYFVIAGLAAVVIAGACTEERSDLTDVIAPNAYGFQLVGAATNLPRGSVRFVVKRTAADVTPESVTVSIRGLDSLGAGYWTPWIGDSLGGSFKRATGQLTVIRQDTSLNALGQVDTVVTTINVGSVSSVKNGGANQGWTWSFTRASSGLVASDSISVFLISLEDSPTATAPSTSRPLWARRGEGTAVPATGTAFRTSSIKFGNWSPIALTDYLFSVTPARGRGYFQQQTLSINDSSLTRPPVGFYYSFYAVGPFYVPSDTTFLGDQGSPYPRREITHYDADVSVAADPIVILDTPPSILAGALRVRGSELGLPSEFPYSGFNEIWLTIAPKLGVRGRLGSTRILRGIIPFLISTGGLQ